MPKKMSEQKAADWLEAYPELEDFYYENLITGVVSRMKSGKEATVYWCRAHPDLGVDYLAAKVYRPREARSFKNDNAYFEGRTTLDARADKAMHGKSRLGLKLRADQWISQEFQVMRDLHAIGADVPRPYARSENALLIQFIGDSEGVAPQLNSVTLSKHEAPLLFQRLIDNITEWLAREWVHADLSPFNILYFRGKLTVIDFPQAVDPRSNSSAREFLLRDIRNVCRYFSRYGIQADPLEIGHDLWERYMRAEF